MENLPFDLPHTFYINILHILKGLKGLNKIYYTTLMNKILWDQEVYHVFNKMDEDYKHTIVVKEPVLSKQKKFNKANLKAMKVVIDLVQKQVPQVDEEAINKRKQKRQDKAIANEDKGLNNIGIAKRFKRL